MEEEKNNEITLAEMHETENAEQQLGMKEIKSHHAHPQDGRGRYFAIRQVLNILFMVIALVGVCLYIWWNEIGGIIIVIIAMAFKMAECVLRYLK